MEVAFLLFVGEVAFHTVVAALPVDLVADQEEVAGHSAAEADQVEAFHVAAEVDQAGETVRTVDQMRAAHYLWFPVVHIAVEADGDRKVRVLAEGGLPFWMDLKAEQIHHDLEVPAAALHQGEQEEPDRVQSQVDLVVPCLLVRQELEELVYPKGRY